jgi:hypothetical protein
MARFGPGQGGRPAGVRNRFSHAFLTPGLALKPTDLSALL